MTLTIMANGIMILNIMMTLSIMAKLWRLAEHYCCTRIGLFSVMVRVIILSVGALRIVLQSFIMLNVVMTRVVMKRVMAPHCLATSWASFNGRDKILSQIFNFRSASALILCTTLLIIKTGQLRKDYLSSWEQPLGSAHIPHLLGLACPNPFGLQFLFANMYVHGQTKASRTKLGLSFPL